MDEEKDIRLGDRFDIVVPGGVWSVRYNLNQVHDDGYAKYIVEESPTTKGATKIERISDGYWYTEEMSLGDNISTTIADDVVDAVDCEVYGFIVPDHLLSMFISQYPDKEIYRL